MHNLNKYQLRTDGKYVVIHFKNRADGGQRLFDASKGLTMEYCNSIQGKFIVCELTTDGINSRFIPLTQPTHADPLASAGSFKTSAIEPCHISKWYNLSYSSYSSGRVEWYITEITPSGRRHKTMCEESIFTIHVCENCGHGAGVMGGAVKCEMDGIPADAFACDTCGEFIRGDDARRWYKCRRCCATIQAQQHGYHNYPLRGILKFTRPDHREKSLHMGLELEMQNANGETGGSLAAAISKIMNADAYNPYCHFERDGSLINGGLELITQPCTMTEHGNQRAKWEKVFDEMGRRDFSTATSAGHTCGLHVHFDRLFFGNQNRYKALCLAYLMECIFERDLNSIDGRKGQRSYCKKHGLERNDDPLTAAEKMTCEGHTASLNIINSNTIELRIWGDARTPARLFALLDISQALARLAKSMTYEKLPKAKFEHLGKFLAYETTAAELERAGLATATAKKLQAEYNRQKRIKSEDKL